MAKRSSNRNRIERMREEAAATARDKPKSVKPKNAKPTGRLKMVWGVKNSVGEIVKTYPYPQKAAAEAEAARMRDSGQRGSLVCPHKVPLED